MNPWWLRSSPSPGEGGRDRRRARALACLGLGQIASAAEFGDASLKIRETLAGAAGADDPELGGAGNLALAVIAARLGLSGPDVLRGMRVEGGAPAVRASLCLLGLEDGSESRWPALDWTDSERIDLAAYWARGTRDRGAGQARRAFDVATVFAVAAARGAPDGEHPSPEAVRDLARLIAATEEFWEPNALSNWLGTERRGAMAVPILLSLGYRPSHEGARALLRRVDSIEHPNLRLAAVESLARILRGPAERTRDPFLPPEVLQAHPGLAGLLRAVSTP